MRQKGTDYKSHCIRVAGIAALLGNAILAAVKLLFAYLSGSLAVLGDGIDSSTDVLIAIVTLIISGIIAQPSDKEHPWGHVRAETTATLVLSFIIFYAGTQVIVQAAASIIRGTASQEVSPIAVTGAAFSIAGKALLAAVEFHYARLADSEMVKANAQNMKSDIVLSAGVLLGLATSKLFRCPVLDPIIAVAVGGWVIKNAVQIFRQTNLELMDGNTDNSLYRKLFEAAASVPGVTNPHRARIRRMASLLDVDLDIEVAPDMTVYDAHELSEQVEEAVRRELPDIYDIVVHIEPAGSDNHQRKEEFGLTPGHLEKEPSSAGKFSAEMDFAGSGEAAGTAAP